MYLPMHVVKPSGCKNGLFYISPSYIFTHKQNLCIIVIDIAFCPALRNSDPNNVTKAQVLKYVINRLSYEEQGDIRFIA